MVNNNKCFDIFFRCIFLFSIILLVSIFVKAYITKKDTKEGFFTYKAGHTCRNTNSGGTANWGYGLRAFHIGAAGPANNDGKQIMSWDHNRIKNECKKIAESRFGKTGYSGISVHHTGPWHTRGCDIYHKQTKPIETTPYSGKHCYINPDFVPLVPEIKGCTNPEADNYNPNANKENYSCIITGCTDPEANNFNPNANTNDNSCVYVDGICETCEEHELSVRAHRELFLQSFTRPSTPTTPQPPPRRDSERPTARPSAPPREAERAARGGGEAQGGRGRGSAPQG
mgnify:CR=1 FL=1